MKLLTAKDLNLLREIFLMGEMSKFLAVGYDFSPFPGFPIKVVGIFPTLKVSHKVSGEGRTVITWWVQLFCDIFGNKRDAWCVILGYNPSGHGFVLRDLVLIKHFQVSHNCITECTLQAKFLLKLI